MLNVDTAENCKKTSYRYEIEAVGSEEILIKLFIVEVSTVSQLPIQYALNTTAIMVYYQ